MSAIQNVTEISAINTPVYPRAGPISKYKLVPREMRKKYAENMWEAGICWNSLIFRTRRLCFLLDNSASTTLINVKHCQNKKTRVSESEILKTASRFKDISLKWVFMDNNLKASSGTGNASKLSMYYMHYVARITTFALKRTFYVFRHCKKTCVMRFYSEKVWAYDLSDITQREIGGWIHNHERVAPIPDLCKATKIKGKMPIRFYTLQCELKHRHIKLQHF